MSQQVAVTKEKVQRYVTDLAGSVSIDRDGDFHIRNGSSHVFLSVTPFGENNSIVRIFAPINRDVPESPELYKYVASSGSRFAFGSISAREENGKVHLYLGHALLGEFLDPEELTAALSAIAYTADLVDDEIKAKFGGTRFHES